MEAIRLPPIGCRVRIIRTVQNGHEAVWTAATEGRFLGHYTEATSELANAYKGSPSGEYPLERVRIRLDDGTIADLVLQPDTTIDWIDEVPRAGTNSTVIDPP